VTAAQITSFFPQSDTGSYSKTQYIFATPQPNYLGKWYFQKLTDFLTKLQCACSWSSAA